MEKMLKIHTGQVSDVQTENNQRLSSIDIFLARHFFCRPTFVEYYKVVFQNINNKYTYGIALGYDILSSSRTN